MKDEQTRNDVERIRREASRYTTEGSAAAQPRYNPQPERHRNPVQEPHRNPRRRVAPRKLPRTSKSTVAIVSITVVVCFLLVMAPMVLQAVVVHENANNNAIRNEIKAIEGDIEVLKGRVNSAVSLDEAQAYIAENGYVPMPADR